MAHGEKAKQSVRKEFWLKVHWDWGVNPDGLQLHGGVSFHVVVVADIALDDAVDLSKLEILGGAQ